MRPIRAVTAVDRSVLEKLGHHRGRCCSMISRLADPKPVANSSKALAEVL
jgi:hypothetical protein